MLAGCDDGSSTSKEAQDGGGAADDVYGVWCGPYFVEVQSVGLGEDIVIHDIWCDGSSQRIDLWRGTTLPTTSRPTGFTVTVQYSGCPGELHVFQVSEIDYPTAYNSTTFNLTIDGQYTCRFE